jgi:hypothetical protein
MADRWQLTCSCARWRAFTETDVDANRLAAEHERERGTHVVTIEGHDDYRSRLKAARAKYLRSI